jgi:hypothetical protein
VQRQQAGTCPGSISVLPAAQPCAALILFVAPEIDDHAGNRKLIGFRSVRSQFVGDAASLALRYPVPALHLHWLRFQFALESEHDMFGTLFHSDKFK